jgi:hypothetical protein
MTHAHRITRRTAAGLRLVAFLTAVLGAVGLARGQASATAAAAALPKKTFTKNVSFDLPIVMDDALRATLREVCLYVKRPTTGWTRHEAVPPSATRFSHKVGQDGEYWFSLVTVDKQGRMTPSDVGSEPPGLRVVVDTQPPTLQVQPWTGPGGEHGLRCTVQDANPDPASLKAICHFPSGDAPLEMIPGQPSTVRVRGEAMTCSIRVTATDQAGNTAYREVSPRDLFPTTKPAEPVVPAVASQPGPATPAVVSNRVDLKPAPKAPSAPPPVLPPRRETTTPVVVEAAPPAPPAPPSHLPPVTSVPPAVAPNVPPPAVATNIPPASATNMPPAVATNLPPQAAPVQPIATNVPANVTAHNPAVRQVINTTHASVDYRIENVGPSGIGKVEAYVTSDQGQSWRRLTQDADHNSPIPVVLPGEGLFGLRLAITHGNGFGGTPPRAGDSAHCWLEVDTTVPLVTLAAPELGTAGAVALRWTATDKNLGPEPVSLYYRTRLDGPWQPIVRTAKNDGTYRWTFPRDAGSQFYFKVEVTDLAGNVGRVESPSAIVLDTTEPRVSVIGVSGMRATPPNGN